jgi:hypothetical protein
MNNITLTVEEANQILSYLSKQPYSDVAGLIQMIGQKANVKEEETTKTEE